MIKMLWVDDIRRPPNDDWIWARTISDAKVLLQEHTWELVSLDHDMGLHMYDPDEEDADMRIAPDHWAYEDGSELADWMVKEGILPRFIVLHSWNPVGAEYMFKRFVDAGHRQCHILRFERRPDFPFPPTRKTVT